MTGVDNLLAPCLIILTGKGAFLQRHGDFDLFAEDVFRQRFGFSGFVAFFVLPEVFEVAAVVKNQKAPLVGIGSVNLVHAGQPFA